MAKRFHRADPDEEKYALLSLQSALGILVRNEVVEYVKTNPFYWDPFPQDDPSKRPFLEKVLDFFGIAHLIGRPPRASYEWMRIMKGMLIDELEGGSEWATGYALPRSPEDRRVMIPSDVWNGEIDWVRNKVRGGGLEFVGVRLIYVVHEDSDEDSALSGAEKPTLVGGETPGILEGENPRGPGRPSRQKFIIRAYKAIPKDCSAPMSAHYPAIKAEAKRLSNDDSDDGLGDDTIRKTITDLWKADCPQ